MSAIYVDRKNAVLDFAQGALTVRAEGERLAVLPLGGAERVVVRRAGTVTLRLLGALGERGVGLLVLSGRKGEALAHLLGAPHSDARLRLGQFELVRDTARALVVARHFVAGKLSGQQRLLQDALAARPDQRKPLFDAKLTLAELRPKLAIAADIDALRGIEGAAAAAFWRGYTSLFAPALGFVERNRRPPRDPVNASLSLCYTLLHGEAVRAAWVAGLDPCIGFLHALLAGRESLACDLIEPLRPLADRWVWELFRGGVLRQDQFTAVEGACLLGKTGRAAFYEAYEPFALALRARLRRGAAALARAARSAWRERG
jgi:CRISPR-associated protein Cas1